jgi:hypothetical protein
MPLDLSQDQGHAPAPDLGEVLPNRAQRRRQEARRRDVVEADHADIVGHSPASLAHGAQHSQCHVVIGHEDGGRFLLLRQIETK